MELDQLPCARMDLPLDILEHIIRKLGNNLISMACVSYLCKQLADREMCLRRKQLISESSDIKLAISLNKPSILIKLIQNTRETKDRISIIVEAALLCIHRKNKQLLSGLFTNYPTVLRKHFSHILSLTDWPVDQGVYDELIRIVHFQFKNNIT